MKAVLPIAAGEELFNDYGPLPRSDLLRRYGYVTPNYAKHDVAEIPHDLLIASVKSQKSINDADMMARLEYLEDQDLLDTAYDINKQVPGEPVHESFSPELLAVTMTLLLPIGEFQRMREKGKLPKSSPMPASVAEFLNKVVQERIQQYSTTLDEDEKLINFLSPQHLSTRKAMAIQVRAGEKVVLREAEQALRRLAVSAPDSNRTDKRRASLGQGSIEKKQRMV